MIGVTLFGLLFTPAFYVMCRGLGTLSPWAGKAKAAGAGQAGRCRAGWPRGAAAPGPA